MGLKNKKVEKKNVFKEWVTSKYTWIYFVITVLPSVFLPHFFVVGSNTVVFYSLGLTLFLVFSVEKVSTQRRKIRDKNRFVDKLINDEPVDGSLAVHKYRNLISEELDPEDTLKVSTVIGDLEVKVKDLP